MMVETSPSCSMRRDLVGTRPQFEDQQAPSEVPENANRVREAVAGAVAHEIGLHRRRKSELPGPAAGIKDDLLRILSPSSLLVHPGRRHATADLRSSERLRGQQIVTLR